MLYGSADTGVRTRIPGAEAGHVRVFVALNLGFMVLLICLMVAAYIVRGRPSQTYAFRLMTSLGLRALCACLDVVHWSQLLGGKLPKATNSTYNSRFVFTTLLYDASWLVMLVCIMDVLHNRLLAVFRGEQAKKGLIVFHATVTTAMAVLAVVDFGIMTNWVAKLVKYGSTSPQPATAWSMGTKFAAAQESLWLFVMVYVVVAAVVGYSFARKRGAYTQNLLGLVYVGCLLAITKIFPLASGHYAVFGKTTDDEGLRSMTLRMVSKTISLLFAYAGLVVIGKRYHEFIPNQQLAMNEKAREHEAHTNRALGLYP